MKALALRGLEALRHPRRAWPEIRLAFLRPTPAGEPAADGSAPPPRSLTLAVNASCDQACPTCDIGVGRDGFVPRRLSSPGPGLSGQDCARLAEDLGEWRPAISLHDAEPLSHPGWRGMVEAFTRRGFFVSMTTAGTRLDEAAEGLIASGLHHLEISVDAGEEDSYERARGRRDLGRVERGVRRLEEAKRRTSVPYPRISVNAVISDLNAEELPALADRCASWGVPLLTFTHAFYVTPGIAERHNAAFPRWPLTEGRRWGIRTERVDGAGLPDAIEDLRRAHPGLTVVRAPNLDAERSRRYYATEEPIPGYARCRTAWTGAQVLPNGDFTVNLACFAPSFGNVREIPVTALWNGEAFRAFRRALLEGGTPPGCLRCGGLYCG